MVPIDIKVDFKKMQHIVPTRSHVKYCQSISDEECSQFKDCEICRVGFYKQFNLVYLNCWPADCHAVSGSDEDVIMFLLSC